MAIWILSRFCWRQSWMQDILNCFGLENLTNKGILWREYCLFCGYFCGKQHPNFRVKAKLPRVYFYNCHIVKLSLLSLKLSFRSLLQGRQTSILHDNSKLRVSIRENTLFLYVMIDAGAGGQCSWPWVFHGPLSIANKKNIPCPTLIVMVG